MIAVREVHNSIPADKSCWVTLIAELDGAIVGTCDLTGFARTIPILQSLCVQSDYRRRGVASALIKRAESVCGFAGKRAVSLRVSNDNAPAMALYEKLGYVPCVADEDATWMMKGLT